VGWWMETAVGCHSENEMYVRVVIVWTKLGEQLPELRWVLCMRLVAGWPRVLCLLVPGCDAGAEDRGWLVGPLPLW
jgi:hypothetical protein